MADIAYGSLCASCGHAFSDHDGVPCRHGWRERQPCGCRCFVPRADEPARARRSPVMEAAERYAIASVLYYRHHVSPMPDEEFDQLCHWLLEVRAWEQVPWLEEASLRAGTGYTLNFPPELIARAEANVTKVS